MKKQIKESISNIIGKFKDQFEKLKYYTKINSDGSITAYYNKYNPDRLTISITEHPEHPAGRFYLYIYNKVEVSSTSLADPKAAYQTTSARIVKHSTKKVRKYYDDLKKLIVDINKVLSRNNFTLLDYSDINESKQFKLANIARKILKEEGFDKDGNPYGFKYNDEQYYPKKGDEVEATFIGSNPKYKQFKNKPFIDVVTGVSSPSTEPWCAINFKNHGQIKDYNDWNFVKVS